jgi:hypothetical protein
MHELLEKLMEVVHRKDPASTDSKTTLVCGAKAVLLLSNTTIWVGRSDYWSQTTCPDCLDLKPRFGMPAKAGQAVIHLAQQAGGIRCARAATASHRSDDAADVTCKACLRTLRRRVKDAH